MATCPMTEGKSAALASLMSDNPRYKEMFELNTQTANTGVDMDRDYTADMNRLRDQAAVQPGSLRALLGVAEMDFSPIKRDSYTFFSYRACELGFRENLIFSSEGYKESPGVASVGTSILAMVGKPHKRLRSAAQPLFKRPKVLDWWNKRWIEETVDVLLDRLLDQDAVDLNMELCARLPMATVTRAIGLEGEDVLEFRYQLDRATFGAARLKPEEAAESRAWVDQTLRNLIAENTREPGDNLIAGLIKSEIVDEDAGSKRPLTEDEIFGYAKLAIFAGGGTTHRQLGITLDALMNHYNFWEDCQKDRSLVDRAVEEGLRWRATDPVFPRLCVAGHRGRGRDGAGRRAGQSVPGRREPRPRGVQGPRILRHLPRPGAQHGLRLRPAPVPRHGRRAPGDGPRDQRPARPVPQHADRSRQAQARIPRHRPPRHDRCGDG